MGSLVPPSISDDAIWDVWLCAFHAPALAICDELGLFEALRARPLTAAELTTAITIEARGAEAMAGLMTALGFLALADGAYHLTELARHYLLADSPFYWGGFLRRIRTNPIDCNRLIDSLRRGASAREARVSGEMWRAPRPPPQALEAFTHAMHAHSFALAMRAVPALKLDAARTFLDVAGGSGSYAIAAANHHPHLRCTVLDLGPVCAVARDYIAKAGASARIATVEADMFAEAWPSGVDRVFLSDVFHDWDDEQCTALAARAFTALAPGGQIVVHEMLVSDGKDGPLAAVTYSVVMLFATEGRQRSAREVIEILQKVGFVAATITMTSGGYAAIAATRAS